LLEVLLQYDSSAAPTTSTAMSETQPETSLASNDRSTASLPPLPGGPVFDRNKVLQNLGDDEDLLLQLMMMYIDDEARMLDEIDEAIVAKDAHALRQAAHALKGAVGNFAASRAYARALQLEHAGRDGDLSQAAALLDSLREELKTLRKAFNLPDYVDF
jgi:HPt (histidine-containing phosphotransfer) domain-containing protein